MMTVPPKEVPGINPATEKKVWTDEELMSLPDIAGKYEVVDGNLIVTPAETFKREIVGGILIARVG